MFTRHQNMVATAPLSEENIKYNWKARHWRLIWVLLMPRLQSQEVWIMTNLGTPDPGKIHHQWTSFLPATTDARSCHRGSALTPRGGFKTFANICFIIRELLALTPLLVAQLESFSASDGIEAVQRDWEDNSLKFCNFVLKIGAVSGAGVHTALRSSKIYLQWTRIECPKQSKGMILVTLWQPLLVMYLVVHWST